MLARLCVIGEGPLSPSSKCDSVFGQPCVNTSQEPVLGRSGSVRRVSKPHVSHQPWCKAGRPSWRDPERNCVLGTPSEVHMRDYLSSFSKRGACDECHVRDGQVCVRPALFDAWLCALDLVLSTFGATRGGVKQHEPSKAPHAFCVLLSVRESFKDGTRIPVRVTVIVSESHEETSALEAAFGSRRLRISAQAGRIGEGLARTAQGQPERGPCLRHRAHHIHRICLVDLVSHAHQWRRAGS